MYIDFHTHKPLFSDQEDVIEVISMHRHVKYEKELYTIGSHPWWTEKPLDEAEKAMITVSLDDPYFLAIGECGLDKLKGASKVIQEEVFYQHIMIANQYNVPLIVHCVRQYDQVITFKKKYGNTPWVIHGFRRNHFLAKSLLDNGILVSVAPFENMNVSFVDMLKYLPDHGYFLETDSEYTWNIKERYTIMAELKKIDIFALQNQMYKNFITFFKWKENNLIGLKGLSF